MNRVQMYIGKGGVGKSTCSALSGVRHSLEKETVFIESMDPAHNLHDIFKCDFSDKKKKINPFLTVRETDREKVTKKYLKSMSREMSAVYHHQQGLNIDKYFKIMKFSPGMEEYAAWLSLEACFSEEKYEHVIIDTPPTALTLKTLALSSVNLHWIEQLEAMRMEIFKKKEVISRIRREDIPALSKDPVFYRLQKMKGRYKKVLDDLQNPDRTEIVLVLNEDELSFSESVQIQKDLQALSITVQRVIVNKYTGYTERLKQIRREFSSAVIEVLPLQKRSVIGMESLEYCSRLLCEAEVSVTSY